MSAPATVSYLKSDLPIDGGIAYHLGIGADSLAPAIIIVGDPERVDVIAHEHLKNI